MRKRERGEREPLVPQKRQKEPSTNGGCFTCVLSIAVVVLFITSIVAIVNFGKAIGHDGIIGSLGHDDIIFDQELDALNVTSGVFQAKDMTLMDQFALLLQTLVNETFTRIQNDQQFTATLLQNMMERQDTDEALNTTFCDAVAAEEIARQNADAVIDAALVELESLLGDISNATVDQANENAANIALLKGNVTQLQAKDMLLMEQLANGTQFGTMLKNDTTQVDMWLMQTLINVASTESFLNMLIANINALQTVINGIGSQIDAFNLLEAMKPTLFQSDDPLTQYAVADAMQNVNLLGSNIVTMSGPGSNEITIGSGTPSVVTLEGKSGDVILNGQSSNIDVTTTATTLNIDAIDTDTQRPSGKYTTDSGLDLDFDWQPTVWPNYLSRADSSTTFNWAPDGFYQIPLTSALFTGPGAPPPTMFPKGICFFEVVADLTLNSIEFTQEYWYEFDVFAGMFGLDAFISPQCRNTIRFQVVPGQVGRVDNGPETIRTRCTVWVPSSLPYNLFARFTLIGNDNTGAPTVSTNIQYRALCNPDSTP